MFPNARKIGSPALWLLACAWLFTAARGAESQKFETADAKWVNPFAAEKAKAVVLVFVRTDCPISNRYTTELTRLRKKFTGTDWWLVYPDDDVSIAAIREHQKEYKLDIPALRDPHRELVKLAGVRVTPEAAVFLPGRKVAYRGRIDDRFVAFGDYRSEATRRDLEEALLDVVSGKPVRVSETNAVGCTIGSEP